MSEEAKQIFRALYDEHHARWRGGLKRGGEGRSLADWLACKNIEELYVEAVRSRA